MNAHLSEGLCRLYVGAAPEKGPGLPTRVFFRLFSEIYKI